MSKSVRGAYRKLLGGSLKEYSSGAQYVERTGIRYLPPMSLEMVTEISKSYGHTPVVMMQLILLDTRMRNREHDLCVSGKRRFLLNITDRA